MAFDPSAPPSEPRDAASVILLRARQPTGEAEVFLLRRHRKASFMSSAYVFPGGAADEGEDDPRTTAARELFEEAGVLFCGGAVAPTDLFDGWRTQLHDQGAVLSALLRAANLALDVDALHYFAHWITPSAETKRFSAQFFVGELPPGQTPSFDNRETVDEIWVTPTEALERAGELRLPPPQVRTFLELAEHAAAGPSAVIAAATARARTPHPILPRFARVPSAPKGFALLLPWDPEYTTAGTGEAREMPADHPLAGGPSRFILDDDTWKHINAPDLPTAD